MREVTSLDGNVKMIKSRAEDSERVTVISIMPVTESTAEPHKACGLVGAGEVQTLWLGHETEQSHSHTGTDEDAPALSHAHTHANTKVLTLYVWFKVCRAVFNNNKKIKILILK